MRLIAGLRWSLDGIDIDERLVALLNAIAARGSLQQAIGDIGLSYRHAWERLGRLERALGQPLVQLQRGRGARLTPFGSHLTKTTRVVETRLQPELKRAAAELNRPLACEQAAIARIHGLRKPRSRARELAEMLIQRGGPPVELHYQGSLDALISLARKQCDIAGFHVPGLPGPRMLLEPYRPWLKARTLRLIHFADRRQGLIVARRNPLRIESLADLVRRRALRQPAAGIRHALFPRCTPRRASHPLRSNQRLPHRGVHARCSRSHDRKRRGRCRIRHRSGSGTAWARIRPARFGALFSRRAQHCALAPGATGALKAMLKSPRFRSAVRKLPGYTPASAVEALTVKQAFERRPA